MEKVLPETVRRRGTNFIDIEKQKERVRQRETDGQRNRDTQNKKEKTEL